ncbi:glycine--tRNA ligase subunit beta [Candidatus Aerophobetes bacterium]|nr:glycine--tRNA ligase subunit beta [Candidatus Aerophobetes bacterium]
MEKTAILELGVEDLPPSMVKDTLGQLQKFGETLLENYRINYQKVSTWGSSQRLIFCIQGIKLKQEDAVEKDMGPPKKLVYDSEGKLTPAGRQYLKAKKINESSLGIETLKKGEYVYIKKHIKGKKTSAILPSLFTELIRSLRFSKSMRWKDGNFSFGRPLRYIFSVLGEEVVEFEINGIKSGRKTRGNRYLFPRWVEVSDAPSYGKIIRNLGVITHPGDRKKAISQQISKVMLELERKGYKARLVNDEKLLEELCYLIEHPTVFWGEFDSQYLSLPSFILKACLREYQKYFTTAEGEKVLPFFIGVREGGRHNLQEIVENNKRVLHARLNDVGFFYREDKKIPLKERVLELREVIVQEKLGSYYDKIKRLVKLTQKISPGLGVGQDLQKRVERAAYLCKADILTHMGKEFPELQSTLGKEYALHSGEDALVAQAIEEHRRPCFSEDKLPNSLEGAILAIIDKVDTLSGAFWAGFIPSGSEDPWGLRREAQGVVEIIIDKNFDIDLKELINQSMDLYNKNKNDAREKLSEFLRGRIVSTLRDMGIAPDIVNSIMQVDKNKPVDIIKRARAMQSLASREKFEEEIIAIVRLLSILKQAKDWGIKIPSKVSPERFKEKEEINLYKCWEKIKKVVDKALEEREYIKAYKNLSSLKETIHTFFDKVLVMCDDFEIRLNRLSLLLDIGSRFLRIADFTRLQI